MLTVNSHSATHKKRHNLLPDWINPIHKLNRIWQGGVKLKDWKSLSNQTDIEKFKQPDAILRIPLGDGRKMASPCVTIGQYVLKGEVIGRSNQTPWVHASTSGHVIAIEQTPLADRPGKAEAVVLAADGLDLPCLVNAGQSHHQPPGNLMELASLCQQMGLTGLGGAGFPVGLKLAGAGGIDTLLINGAECEPYLTCDDRLMRERAEAIVHAGWYLQNLLQLERVCIGIEPNKPAAIQALRQAIRFLDAPLEVRKLPHRYPAGGQPLLIKSLSGRHQAPGTLPHEIGVMVMNVASLYSLGQAVFHGLPLTSRIVTLSGAMEHPCNVEVPIGTPVSDLLNYARPRLETTGIQVGGPMMGRDLASPDAVITKTSGALIARSAKHLPPKPEAQDCIRCNRCVDTCPMSLRPLTLNEACQTEDRQALQQEQLSACIECGACSEVCPSHIPLRDNFRNAKPLLAGGH